MTVTVGFPMFVAFVFAMIMPYVVIWIGEEKNGENPIGMFFVTLIIQIIVFFFTFGLGTLFTMA